MPTRTLDYRPRLDPRNRAYRVTPQPDLHDVSVFWTPGTVVLDQGREGACVGFGVTGEAMASPVRVKFDDPPIFNAEQAARDVYHRCLQIDEFEGERDEGTSVRAGMLVARERGWCSGFNWAFNMAELRTALETGPVVIGVDWYEDSYDAPEGILRVTGPVVGGHCVLVTGYTRMHRVLKGPAYRIRNSWSDQWGYNGSAYVATTDLNTMLFAAGGEAAVPVGRAL